jgi:predicted dehydrogenase
VILPTIYHLKRIGIAGTLTVCATGSRNLKVLAENDEISSAFPRCSFTPVPELSAPDEDRDPQRYKDVLKSMPPRSAVIVAIPDQYHYEVVMEALWAQQHVLCVKPLVLEYRQAREIEEEARRRGLFVGVEYHKRFDRRSLIAKKDYELGRFGEFAMGEAKMIEPYFYRRSNFQNWFTPDKTDPFVYVGCHYVDLVYFITGLRPVEVSVAGVRGRFPNGNEGYMWANGRLRFENGALLSVTDGLGYPDDGAGSNEQGLTMFCEGDGKTGMIKHNDQFRGVRHSFLSGDGCGGSYFNYINPDFFKLIPWEGEGYRPVGYGYESVAASINKIHEIENAASGLPEAESLTERRRLLAAVDKKGIIATPSNSFINELVVEAARISICSDGRPVGIRYGDQPGVEVV